MASGDRISSCLTFSWCLKDNAEQGKQPEYIRIRGNGPRVSVSRLGRGVSVLYRAASQSHAGCCRGGGEVLLVQW